MTAPKAPSPHIIHALEYLAQFGPLGVDNMRGHAGTPYGMAKWLWPNGEGWKRSGRNGVRGAFMPAKGGRALSDLQRLGYAAPYYATGADWERARWYITNAGQDVLTAAQQVTVAEPGQQIVKPPKYPPTVWPSGVVSVDKPTHTYSTTSYTQTVRVDGEPIGTLHSHIRTPRVKISKHSRIGKDLKPRRVWEPHDLNGNACGIAYETRHDAIARLSEWDIRPHKEGSK